MLLSNREKGFQARASAPIPFLYIAAGVLFLVANTVCAGATSIEIKSLDSFYRQFNPVEGIYYFTSPSVLQTPENRTYYLIESSLKTFEFQKQYIVVYGQKEDIQRKLELAQENIRIIRDHLDASKIDSKNLIGPIQVMGRLDYFVTMVNAICKLNIAVEHQSTAQMMAYGKTLSISQFCGGFGAVMAFNGLKFVVVDNKLEVVESEK